MESRLSVDFDECSSCQTLHLTKSRTFCRGLSYVTKPLSGQCCDRRWHMKGIPPHGFPGTMGHGLEVVHVFVWICVCVQMCRMVSSEPFPFSNGCTNSESSFLLTSLEIVLFSAIWSYFVTFLKLNWHERFIQGNINSIDTAATVNKFPVLKGNKTVFGWICGNRVFKPLRACFQWQRPRSKSQSC